MEVTPEGMTMEARDVHFRNARSPMEVTPEGMVTEVRDVQPLNALYPMEVTLEGMAGHSVTPEGHATNSVNA